MEIDVRQLETDEPGHMDAAIRIRTEMGAESHPNGPAVTPAEVRRQLTSNEMRPVHAFLAFVDDVPAGLVRLRHFELEGSRNIAVCQIEVRPSFRRRRIATTLLRRAVDHCLDHEKSIVIGTGVDGDPVRGFWGSWLGLQCGLVERESQLAVPSVDAELMQRWIEQRHARAGDYRLAHVRGACPPELRAAVATLNTAMNDAPLDDLEVDPEIWTEADVVAEDDFRRQRGEERWMNIVFAPDGEPAGLSAVVLNDEDRSWGSQDNTVVIEAHRERGIARWLKADMWQRLRADRPELDLLLVENAASNDAMLAINEAMGFRETVRWSEWQADATELRATLLAR